MGVRTYIYLPEPSDLHALAFLAGSVPPPSSALEVAMPPPSTASSSTSGAYMEPTLLAVGGALPPPSTPSSAPGASTATATEPRHGKGSKPLSQLLAEMPVASLVVASAAAAPPPPRVAGVSLLARAKPLSGVSLLALAAEALSPSRSLGIARLPRTPLGP